MATRSRTAKAAGSHDGKKAQFILGYHGYIQMALRTGQYRDLGVMEIRQGEYLGRDPSTGKPRFKFEEDDCIRMELPVVGYMAYFEYLNGFQKVLYWSRQKMMTHADTYSKAFSAEAYRKIQENHSRERNVEVFVLLVHRF